MSVLPHEDKICITASEANRAFENEQDVASSSSPYAHLQHHGPPGPSHSHSHLHHHQQQQPQLHPRTATPFVDTNRGAGGREHQLSPQTTHVGEMVRGTTVDHGVEEEYTNWWFATRGLIRPYLAEFLGTFVLVLWGEGTQAQVVASRGASDDWISVSWGWGVGFALALYVSAGISGGHINPAVTISLAIFRQFSWKKVPGYILAQFLGSFIASACIFGLYYWPLHAVEGGPASIMLTGPAKILPNASSSFFATYAGAALLMGAICTLTDSGNNPTTPGLTPLLLGLTMVGLATSFGFETGFPLNPARDLGPRLLIWATGNGQHGAIWLAHSAYGIWIPTLSTVTGAISGNFVYDVCCYEGRDSPLNANYAKRSRTSDVEHIATGRLSESSAMGGALNYSYSTDKSRY